MRGGKAVNVGAQQSKNTAAAVSRAWREIAESVLVLRFARDKDETDHARPSTTKVEGRY